MCPCHTQPSVTATRELLCYNKRQDGMMSLSRKWHKIANCIIENPISDHNNDSKEKRIHVLGCIYNEPDCYTSSRH